MGLLDDAIREHLELKRRRGADPADIERAEREALGPVRRRFDDQSELSEPGSAAEPEPEENLDEDWHDEPLPDAPTAGSRALEPEYEELDDPSAPPRWEHEDRLPAAEPTAPPAPPPSPSPLHDLDAETSEYDVPVHDVPEGEDVLEETPDFLQDTPDHDRLWFEQRPPRDFDFDG